jgi:hypothetical protein
MRSNHIDMRSHKRPRNKSGGQVVKIKISAKEDLVEDVRAVYGDYTAEQMKRSAIMLVEIVVVDHDGTSICSIPSPMSNNGCSIGRDDAPRQPER